MNTVMSSQNHAMKTNTVKTSTKKLRKVKPSLTNSIAILHVSDAQNGRGPVIAQLQLPNYPDGQDDVLRDTVKALDCFEDTIDLSGVGPGACPAVRWNGVSEAWHFVSPILLA